MVTKASTEHSWSFRDPSGSLIVWQGRVLRVVKTSAAPTVTRFLASAVANHLLESGKLIPTSVVGDPENLQIPLPATGDYELALEHESVWFPSYPIEWPAEMLYTAAGFTLDLALILLMQGWGIKDATPYNVLYRGPRPVFVDLSSIEERRPVDPVWLPYNQFVSLFLFPLLANRYLGLGFDQIFLSSSDGITPEAACRMFPKLLKWRPPLLQLATIPYFLSKLPVARSKVVYKHREVSPERARFTMQATIAGLKRALRHAQPRQRASHWSNYMTSAHRYSHPQLRQKEEFVRRVLSETEGPVLDVGCNTGHFSLLASRSGKRVVAIDADPVSVSELWRQAERENLDILPLVVDLARPTPSLGWCNAETKSFLQRAHLAFDTVLLLAVVHHLIVSARVPLDNLLRLLQQLTKRFVVIEFVSATDPMFRRLLRGREDLHRDWTRPYFEEKCANFFHIRATQPLENSERALYLLERRSP